MCALGFQCGAASIAFDVELKDGGAMHEPVYGRQGHGLFGEDRTHSPSGWLVVMSRERFS